MRVDISLLPALAATFMLVFARVGAMVMLLPGFGESNIPVRIKLAIALLLTLIILPLFVARRARDRRKLRELLAADAAAEQAERESVLAMLLQLGIEPHDRGTPSGAPIPPPTRPPVNGGEAT